MNAEEVKRLSLTCEQSEGSIDIIGLASKLGINVYQIERPDEYFNAQINWLSDEEKFEILVNGDQSLNRQRFSVAHEIAHYALHCSLLKEKKQLHRTCSNDRQEEEADKLAEELLIPEELINKKFLNALNGETLSFLKVQEIASYFKVSLVVAAIRLRNLKQKVPYIPLFYSA